MRRMHEFLVASAKDTVAAAVQKVELVTSAELVVAVRARSGAWRDPAYLVGFLMALSSLLALLYLPQEFALWLFPVDVATVFILSTAAMMFLPGVRAALYPKAAKQQAALMAARAAFVELGIDKTRARTGVLVFVSALERQVEVVPDAGVPVVKLGAQWTAWVERLRAAVKAADFAAFVEAVEAAGPVLSGALPRGHDDVNELADHAA